MAAVELVQVWRGPICENRHRGHAVVWHAEGGLVAAWGDPAAVMYPRSACKMVQALPLVESGAAAAAGLGPEHLALACASHTGAALHHGKVKDWLAAQGLGESDLRCGPQWPDDRDEHDRLVCAHAQPDQRHNNCSGKHAGFLTLTRHIGGGADYVDPDHPVQVQVRAAFEEVTGEASPGYGIDGCSAPNFATSVAGLARAMAAFAVAGAGSGVRDAAMARLRDAMRAHPELVGGPGNACTDLMRATGGRAAVKTGADGVYVAIVPERRLGLALKIEDGSAAAKQAVVAQLLVGAGVLDAAHPTARALVHGPVRNRREIAVGHVALASDLAAWSA